MLAAVAWGAGFMLTARSLRVYAAPGIRRLMALIAATGLAATLAGRNWAAAGFCAATLALLFGDWWKRCGRKIARVLGAKGRAVIAGLMEKLRGELEPAPEGVRA